MFDVAQGLYIPEFPPINKLKTYEYHSFVLNQRTSSSL